MFSLSDNIPKHLLGKFELISTVTFSVLFSLVSLLLSLPFTHNAWFAMSSTKSFKFTVLFFFLAILIVSASKRAMYHIRNSIKMTYLIYIGWNLVEVIAVSLLYIFFTIKGDELGIIKLEMSRTILFANTFTYCSIMLGVPYVISAMFFIIQDKDNTIRMINYGNVVSDENLDLREDRKITLFDNSGALKLSVNVNNLYYIESDDNYIKVWYDDTKGILKQYMLRCRLKTVEDSFCGSNLLRCHRKYIVNMDKVAILSREKDGYYLNLGNEAIEPIPVTKTYEEIILARFNSRSID